MKAEPVIAIFDVGKTNKKLFLFDEHYRIVFEKSAKFIETTDEDDFPCENLDSLRLSVFDSLSEIARNKQFQVKAVNFSAYGASLVNLDVNGNTVGPMYNYLKPYPDRLLDEFYGVYGGIESFSLQTASPSLGSLNCGLQLYRLKKEKPDLFNKTAYALHLPQYLSFLLTGRCYSDLTSIGCHTGIWNFGENRYHEWVHHEGVSLKFAPIEPSVRPFWPLCFGGSFKVGIGLHDSSAALVPYLFNFSEPFVLISTGTWCISMAPFNNDPLTAAELQNDCLCYMQYEGRPVKASRIFAGYEHEQQVKRIAVHFNTNSAKYRNIEYDPAIAQAMMTPPEGAASNHSLKESFFGSRDIGEFRNDIVAYYQLIFDLVKLQARSTQLVMDQKAVKRIFVDGGFSRNSVYMNLLATAFPGVEVFAASMAQATALGAAIVLHKQWNSKALPSNLIELNYYGSKSLISS